MEREPYDREREVVREPIREREVVREPVREREIIREPARERVYVTSRRAMPDGGLIVALVAIVVVLLVGFVLIRSV